MRNENKYKWVDLLFNRKYCKVSKIKKKKKMNEVTQIAKETITQ